MSHLEQPSPTRRVGVDRRRVLALAAAGIAGIVAPAAFAQSRITPMHVYRDPYCGCCHVWAEQMSKTGLYTVIVHEEADMSAVKRRLRIPPELGSCHTAVVDGYVIEGHVPADAVARVLKSRPRGVFALAVPGMPAGSPGMERPDGAREAFDVIALSTDGSRTLFARYPAVAP